MRALSAVVELLVNCQGFYINYSKLVHFAFTRNFFAHRVLLDLDMSVN